MSRRAARYAILVILLVAAGARFSGLKGSGYPYSFYGDEVNNIERSVRFHDPQVGFDLNPHWFNKPALGYYIYFGEFGFYYLHGRYIAGWWDSPRAFALEFIDPATRGGFYLIARTSNILFALLTIFFLYRASRRFYCRETSVIAAAVLALVDGHVAWSQVAKQDVPATALAVIALGFVVKVARKGRHRDYLLSGLAAGLGTALKYTPVVVLLPLFLAHRLVGHGRQSRWLFVAGLSLVAGFFVGSPFNFLDGTWAGGNLTALGEHALQMLGFGAGEVDPGRDSILMQLAWGFWEFLGFGYSRGGHAFGIPLTICLFLGLRRVLSQRAERRRAICLLSFVISILLILAITSPQRFRKNHLVMIYPVCAIFSAHGFHFLWELVRHRVRGGSALVLAGVVLLVPLPGFPGWNLADRVRTMNTRRSELVAMDALSEFAPDGSTIINDTEILPLSFPPERLEWLLARIDVRIAAARTGLENATTPLEHRHHKTNLDHFTSNRIKYTLLKEAPGYSSRARWDVIVLLKVWQTERRELLRQATFGSSDLWQRLPMGEGFPEATRHTARCYQVDPATMPLPSKARQETVVLPGGASDFVVTADMSYENYQTPEKRANWPEWARFYDDLRDHYDCWLINGEKDIPGPTIRIYDLRKRLPAGATPEVRIFSQ